LHAGRRAVARRPHATAATRLPPPRVGKGVANDNAPPPVPVDCAVYDDIRCSYARTFLRWRVPHNRLLVSLPVVAPSFFLFRPRPTHHAFARSTRRASRAPHPRCDRVPPAGLPHVPRRREMRRARHVSPSARALRRRGAPHAQLARSPCRRPRAAPPTQARVLPVSAPPHPAAPQLRSVPLSLGLMSREIGANCLASATSGMSGATAHLRRAPRRLIQQLRRGTLWNATLYASSHVRRSATSTRGGTRPLVASPFLQTGAVKRALLARKNGAATAHPPAPVGVCVYYRSFPPHRTRVHGACSGHYIAAARSVRASAAPALLIHACGFSISRVYGRTFPPRRANRRYSTAAIGAPPLHHPRANRPASHNARIM
jgi:hypothetical protein